MEEQIQEKGRGFRPLRSLRRLLLGLAAAALLGAGCFYGGIFAANRADTGPQVTQAMLEQRLQGLSELASVKYVYTNMGQFEESNDFYGVKIPFTKKKFIVAYDGVIRAGVDLSQAKITLGEDSIRVALPPAKLLSHEIREESLEVFDESKNIFNPISIQDYNQFQIDQKDGMEEKAITGGLLTEAGEKARLAVSSLLGEFERLGFAVTVELDNKAKPAPAQ